MLVYEELTPVLKHDLNTPVLKEVINMGKIIKSMANKAAPTVCSVDSNCDPEADIRPDFFYFAVLEILDRKPIFG